MRKPFEPFKFMVSGVPSQDIVTIKEANAAIEQDTEFHRDRLKYWSEQELKVLRERDALKAQLAEATVVLEYYASQEHVADNEDGENARAYLDKHRADGKGE